MRVCAHAAQHTYLVAQLFGAVQRHVDDTERRIVLALGMRHKVHQVTVRQLKVARLPVAPPPALLSQQTLFGDWHRCTGHPFASNENLVRVVLFCLMRACVFDLVRKLEITQRHFMFRNKILHVILYNED